MDLQCIVHTAYQPAVYAVKNKSLLRSPHKSPVPCELLIRGTSPCDSRFCYDQEMRDLVILFVQVIATLARLLGAASVPLSPRQFSSSSNS
jgi:hypothetical protein